MIYRTLDSVPDEGFVVAREVGASGAREFHSFASLAEFAAVAAGSERAFHEIIRHDVPVKLYVDVDGKGRSAADGDACVARFIAIANEEDPTLGKPVVWTADRPDKCSRHMIWEDEWFDCGASLDAFVRRVAARVECDMVDLSYPVRGTRFMRTPYSHKLSHPDSPLVPLGGPVAYDAARMCRSLVTAHAGARGCRGSAAVEVPRELRCVEVVAPRSAPTVDADVVARVTSTLGVTVRPGHVPAGNVYPIVERQWCPIAGRRHDSNNTAVRVEVRGRWVDVTFVCLDPECRRGRWRPSRDCAAAGWTSQERKRARRT